MPVPPIFQDPDLQARFDKQGFVIVPFLNANDVQYLTNTFYELNPDIPIEGGFVSSSYARDLTYKKTVSERVTAVFKPHFAEYFQNYRPFGSAYLYKNPVANSELPIHQDWTIVDEQQYVALNIWTPLCDVDVHNGSLAVLPGSHSNTLQVLRAPTLPFFFTGNEQLMLDNLVPLTVKAGQAVILNQSLVHYSPPNTSQYLRLAITSGVMTADAPMLFHYNNLKNDDASVEVFAQKDDFLVSFDNFHKDIFERPKMGTSIKHMPYTIPQFTLPELDALIDKMYARAEMTRPTKNPFIQTSTAKRVGNLAIQILQNRQLDEQLAEQGYVVVPLLPSKDVETLSELYYQHHTSTPTGLYATAHSNDSDFKIGLNNTIKKVFDPHVQQVFHECNLLGGSFIAKTPGPEGYLFPHQDWSLVDETQYRSFNIWVPLVDTEPKNGGIYVLPKSHNLLATQYRGPNIPPIFGNIGDLLWEIMTPLHIPAGHALIYDHRLLHASPVNQTQEIRLTAVYGIIPKSAQLQYYYKNGEAIEVFKSNVDFFFEHNPEEGPKNLTSLGLVPYDFPNINAERFKHLYLGETIVSDKSANAQAATPNADITSRQFTIDNTKTWKNLLLVVAFIALFSLLYKLLFSSKK